MTSGILSFFIVAHPVQFRSSALTESLEQARTTGHFGLIWPKTENVLLMEGSLKNTNEIIVNHKETRMVKDGED